MKYSEEIVDQAKNPQNFGELLDSTHSARETNAACGDMAEFYLRIEKGLVKDVKWKGLGCALMTATASMFSEVVKGMKVSEILGKEEKKWVEELMGEVNPGRMKCALLPVIAVKKAVS